MRLRNRKGKILKNDTLSLPSNVRVGEAQREGGPYEAQEGAMRLISGYSQVVCVSNGVERVVAPCLENRLAKRMACNLNRDGAVAECRPLKLPDLTRNPLRKRK